MSAARSTPRSAATKAPGFYAETKARRAFTAPSSLADYAEWSLSHSVSQLARVRLVGEPTPESYRAAALDFLDWALPARGGAARPGLVAALVRAIPFATRYCSASLFAWLDGMHPDRFVDRAEQVLWVGEAAAARLLASLDRVHLSEAPAVAVADLLASLWSRLTTLGRPDLAVRAVHAVARLLRPDSPRCPAVDAVWGGLAMFLAGTRRSPPAAELRAALLALGLEYHARCLDSSSSTSPSSSPQSSPSH